MEADLLSLIGNYGFPIVMVLWFMFRTERIIERNSVVIESLKDVVSQLCNRKIYK